ncbi:LacI family transcriptional regulator [Aquimarina sp. ERC-38]|uniref:LacI family DNA-binding transcriptional regulator n=1 Tax=Aquimarina sp. ERC-38 TaxID=2949996 RepID=UPI00224662EC|nr:LacI family DNA-binding transcriptional regulator [Aquimarina sp. ERC-38]UZO81496.1 LacI family transcriptional regulator [Aquimarina sp. ERC-38]
MKKKVTLKQLAKELNLSISTVSKSLKNDPEISRKTIVRVRELAKFYNYKPNALAVSLKSSKTKTIGVLLPEILNNFFATALFGIQQEAAKEGYKIVTCFTNESYQKEVDYLETLTYSSVDGIILALSQETQIKNKVSHITELAQDNIPVVLFDRVSDTIQCDKVIIDDYDASKKAVSHLLDSGCKHILVISTIHELSVGKLRAEGAQKVVTAYTGATLSTIEVTQEDEGAKEITAFLKNHKVDGILGFDELSVALAIHIVNAIGKKIPEEIAIIGFSDSTLSRYSSPKITTISQHAEELGSMATALLLKRMNPDTSENTPNFTTKVVKTSLLKRASTR